MPNIKSKTGRDALAARREPYWHRVKTGVYVGYRKLEQGDGTWIARKQEPGTGKKLYRALGCVDDGSNNILDVAIKAATNWAEGLDHGVTNKATTVADACTSYTEHLATHKSQSAAKDAQGRFSRLVYGKSIGRIDLAKLKTTDLKSWLNAQVAKNGGEDDARSSKDSANRNLSSLKAALNMALKDRLIASDAGWKTVTPFKDVGERRKEILTREQRTSLLSVCPDDLRQLVTGLLLTGARPGELANACVKDFDREQGTISLDGKTGKRIATLSTAARQFFTEQTKGRIGNAPILVREYGQQWDKDAWKKPFKAAVNAAGLHPDLVAYSLRHTAITEMINGGMNSSVVAMLAGTSTAMIDKHYGKLIHEKTREKMDKVNML